MRKITFSGNHHLKDKQIKAVMTTQEKGWFSWFTGSGTLDEEVIEQDRKQIEGLYHDNGFVRAKIGIPDIVVSPDGKTITIAIPLEEGNEYKVGQIEFKGDIIFDQAEMTKKLKSQSGKTFRVFPVPGLTSRPLPTCTRIGETPLPTSLPSPPSTTKTGWSTWFST